MPRKRRVTAELDPSLLVAGVDEAGRGPLAGPVVVAAVILDASKPEYANCTSATPCRFYLYTPQLDHLSNDAENFGGMMTEIVGVWVTP